MIDKIIDEFKETSKKSDGEAFESACYNAIVSLKYGEAIPLGQRMGGKFKRISDNAWLLKLVEGKLLIMIENKAGDAINTLSFDKQKEDLSNTYDFLQQNQKLENLKAIWLWIIGGESVLDPRELHTHGGKRSGDDLFDKIKKIYSFLKKKFSQQNYKIKVSTFSLGNFILYYKYLNSKILNKDSQITEDLENFWDWNSIFKEPYDIFGHSDHRLENLGS